MAHEITWSIRFETEEGDVSRPADLVMTIVDADGRNFIVMGRRRGVFVLGTAPSPIFIPLAKLGYRGVDSVDEIDDLWLQPIGLRRERITVDVSASIPAKMTSGFTIGDWDPETGFNVAVATPPASPDTITGYLLRADLDPFWSATVAVEDLPADVPFNPLSFPEWAEGVAAFDVDLTIAAVTDQGTVGLVSDPVTKAIAQTDVYYVDDADWTLTSLDDEAPEGRVTFELLIGSSFAPPAPWQARAYVGPVPAGADADTLLPLDWATLENTVPVASVFTADTGLQEGADAKGLIVLFNTLTGQKMLGSEVKTVEVLPLDLPGTIPVIASGPTLTGPSGGVSRIGVLHSGDATWTGSVSRSNRILVDDVEVGSVANDAPATYTPLAADDGKFIRVRSRATGSGGAVTTALSDPVPIRFVAPAAVGSIPAQALVSGAGPWTISAVTVAAAFSGSARVYSIQSAVATIDASTGEITIPDSAPLTESARVTVSNSGGSAFVDFTIAISAGELVFPPAIPNSAWRIVEVRDATEAAGVTGKRKLEWLETVTVPTGFQLYAYFGTESVPPWSTALTLVTPGIDFTTTNGLAVGTVVRPALGWRRISGGAFQTASSQASFSIQGILSTPPGDSGDLPQFTDAQYSQATSMAATNFGANGGAGTNAGWFGRAAVVEAWESLAGRTAADSHVLSQVRAWLGATTCIDAKGGFNAQMEMIFATVCTLAKLNDRLWLGTGLAASLTPFNASEKNRITLQMQALAVSGAYNCSTKNPDIAAGLKPSRNLASGTNWWSTNFNFSGAPPAIVHICAVFFGASALTSFLNSLSIANLISQLNAAGLTRTADTFEALPNTGSTTAKGGAGAVRPSKVQVQNAVANWVCATPDYVGQTVNTPQAAAISAMNRCFSEPIMSGLGGTASNDWIGPGVGGGGKIVSGASGLPNRGQTGMQMEFRSTDASGARSALTPYVLFGVRVLYDMLMVLAAAGLIDRLNPQVKTAVARANRGEIDKNYKHERGYINTEKGTIDTYTPTGTGANGGLTWTMTLSGGGAASVGYTRGTWDVIKAWFDTPPPSATSMVLVGSKTTTAISGAHMREDFKVRCNAIPRDVDVTVRLPPNYAGGTENYHLVFAFPGQSSPITTIINYSTLNAAQNARPMIWISFDNKMTASGPVNRSWGLNSTEVSASQWQDFMAEALPFFKAHYRTVGKKVACAGISMGGFSSMTAVMDLLGEIDAVSTMSSGILGYDTSDFLDPVLGTNAAFPERRVAVDIERRIDEALAASQAIPPIQVLVAPGESNYGAVQNWRNYLQPLGLLTSYSEAVTGGHETSNWSSFMDPCSTFLWNQLQAA